MNSGARKTAVLSGDNFLGLGEVGGAIPRNLSPIRYAARVIMEQLSAAELLELILLAEGSIDVQFQLWLTSTFAMIVASFAGRHLLTTKMRWVVTVLYFLATFVFGSRWYYDAQNIVLYREKLAQVGFDDATPVATAISRVVLMLCGTLATLYFLHADRQSKDS